MKYFLVQKIIISRIKENKLYYITYLIQILEMYTSPALANANIKSVIMNTAITVKGFC